MAIKGKKKAQGRGSQARRRPAAPPRAAAVRDRRVPWYRTTAAVVTAILVLVSAIGIIAAVIANNRSEEDQREQQRAALQEYAGGVRAVLTQVDPVASEMTAAVTAVTSNEEEALADLPADSRKWQTDLEAAGTEATSVTPAPGVETANQLIFQAVQLYSTGAKMFEIVADLTGDEQADALQRASDINNQAGTLWATAVSMLDAELAEVGGSPSGIPIPGTSAPAPAPSPTPTPAPKATVDIDRGGKGKDGKDGKGNNGGD